MDHQKSGQMISRLNQLFNYLGVDHEQNINSIIAHTCKILNSMCSLYNRIDIESRSLVTRSGFNLPAGFHRIVPPEGCICFEETIQNIANPTIIEDISQTSYSVSDINVRTFGLKSYLGFPIVLNGKAAGTLCIVDKKKRQFTSTEINLIAILAKAISIEENRWQAAEELKNSEERLKILFEFAPDAYYLSDLDGVFVDGNKAAEEILRVKRTDLIGKNYFDLNLLSPDQLPKAAELLARNMTGEPTGPDEFTLSRSDGSVVPVEIRTFPVMIKGRHIALGITRDISERIIAQKALRTSERRLSRIVEGNAIATFVIDQDHVITHWNRACENLTGYRALEMIGTRHQFKPFNKNPGPVMADFVLDNVKIDVMERYYGKTFRQSAVIKDGFEAERFVPMVGDNGKWLFFTAAPLVDTDGTRIGAMETLQDITERKLAQAALENARNELEEKVAERTLNLEEVNTALKVLLKTKDDNARQIEERILFNIDQLVMPYLKKLHQSELSDQQQTLLDILTDNLNDTISSSSPGISMKLLPLTPTEIQVANFVKQGKPTKEIAGILNLSVKTIETHRKNIRTKIGIRNKKVNLRTFLIALS